MRRGFTLVELLAVIVILALVALITIPVILNVIEKSKIKTYQRSIDAYGRSVNKAIAEYILDHEKDTNKILSPEDIQSYIKYEGNKVECTTFEIYKDKTVYLANCKVNGESLDYTYGMYQDDSIATTQSYVGYYADVDGDGTVDGVIYADLAHPKNGKWGPYQNGNYIDNGEYSYEAQDNLKKYLISENKYNGSFGEKEIITLKGGTEGNPRFYVMALKDFTEGSITRNNIKGLYYWYYNAYSYGGMTTWETDTSRTFGTGYTNTGNIIRIWNKNGNGTGSYSGATQDSNDIWGHIQGEYAKGWYVPSAGEWAAFADYLANNQGNQLTNDYSTGPYYISNSGNYGNVYELKFGYWSSSQCSSGSAYLISFSDGVVGCRNVNGSGPNGNYIFCIRLGITF